MGELSWEAFLRPTRFLSRRAPAQRLSFGLLLVGAVIVLGVDAANAIISPRLHWAIDVGMSLLTVSVMAGLVITAVKAARREAAKEQVAAIEAERRVMSRELHDSVAQHLCYLHMRLDQLTQEPALSTGLRSDLEELRGVANDAYEQLYRLLSSLRVVPSGNLADALQARAALAGHRAGFEVSLTAEGSPKQITPEAGEEIVQIINEALANVTKHAQAKHLRLKVAWTPETLRIIVWDDGRGFDRSAVEDCGRFGLRIMQERAEQIGGTLQIDSTPDAGTAVQLLIPLSRIAEPNGQVAKSAVVRPT